MLCQHRALSCPSTKHALQYNLPIQPGFSLFFPGHLSCFAARARCLCPRGWVGKLSADLMPGPAVVIHELRVLRPNSPRVWSVRWSLGVPTRHARMHNRTCVQVSSCGHSLIKKNKQKKNGWRRSHLAFCVVALWLGHLLMDSCYGRTLLKPESKCFLLHSVDFAFLWEGSYMHPINYLLVFLCCIWSESCLLGPHWDLWQ